MIGLLVAAGVGLLFTLFLTPVFARMFTRIGWGQPIRDDGPQSHHVKRGTPTMGGIVFIVGAALGYTLGHVAIQLPASRVGLLAFGLMAGMAVIGFIDDLLKVTRRQSLGLSGWAKVGGQVVVATAFALLSQLPGAGNQPPASLAISAVRDIPWLNLAVLGPVVGVLLFVLWVNFVAISETNGTNVTDGLDGLLAGASVFAIGSYILIGWWQFNQWCDYPTVDLTVEYKCYSVSSPLDSAIVAASVAGALIGFLWWNTSPAQIIMGDTGSMALGGVITALAIFTRTELLLVLIGGLFVIEPVSVIIQRAYFKATKLRFGQGRRVFLMSPIHHHFELKGWAEITVVVRFWLIAALFAAAGVGLFYLEWVSR